MSDGGDGGDSGGDTSNPATSNYDPSVPVSNPSGGGDSGTTTAAPDDASTPFAPVFQWVQKAGQWVQQSVDYAETAIGLDTNPSTGNFAISDAVSGAVTSVENAVSAIPDELSSLTTTVEIILGLVAVIVLGVLVFRFVPARKS